MKKSIKYNFVKHNTDSSKELQMNLSKSDAQI